MVPTVTAGEMLQARVEELGVDTAAELARRMRARGCEVSRQTVSTWLRGVAVPSTSARLACLLDVLALEGGARRDMAAAVALSGCST